MLGFGPQMPLMNCRYLECDIGEPLVMMLG